MSRRVIGIDESGKGDFFGPLVVAGFSCTDGETAELDRLGVRDSKKITDNKLLSIDEELRDTFPHVVLVVPPPEYNRRYEKIRNLNKLLAEFHADAIAHLYAETNADLAVSDKFGKTELIELALAKRKCAEPVEQLVRGESVTQVAAASILARAGFVREMKRLSDEFAVDLPKGAAAQVDEAGRRFVELHGVDRLADVAKLHFKNYHRVVSPRLRL